MSRCKYSSSKKKLEYCLEKEEFEFVFFFFLRLIHGLLLEIYALSECISTFISG